MATLNENVARVKDVFRDIRDAVNNNSDLTGFGDDLCVGAVDGYPEAVDTAINAANHEGYIKGHNEGLSEGFDQGRTWGKSEILEQSKYIPKTATGKVISLNDVSEVAHKVKVYGDNQEVDVYGKNLFDISADTRFTEQADGSYVNNVKIGVIEIPLDLPYGTYTLSYELSCPVGKNARIRIRFKDGTYDESVIASTGEFLYFEKVVTGEIESWTVYYASQPEVGTLFIKDAMLCVGGNIRQYEPYTRQTITATPNGTEIDSMCPNMTFIADTDITVDYYSSFGMAEFQSRFADSFQHNGAKRDYTCAFWGTSWNDYTFEQAVNRDIIATSANQMFYNSQITDLAAIMKKKNISIIFKGKGTNFANIFQSSTVTNIPVLIMPEKSGATQLVRGCKSLHTIDGLVCNENTKFTDSFQNCTSFTHCIFSGVIANDINLQWSPLLDEESLISLTETLHNLYEDANPDTGEIPYRTLTLHADCWNRLKSMLYPDENFPDYGTRTYYDEIIYKGWNIA